MTAFVVGACAPSPDVRIDVPGYPACLPGGGGDLSSSVTPDLTLTIDIEDVSQEILGFGASDCWSIQYVGQWPQEKREAIADLLFETALDGVNDPRGAGLSVWRFNIGAGSNRLDNISESWRKADTFYDDDFSQYDWGRLPGQRWFLDAANVRGVDRFIAFVNSPPINMTKNGRAFCDIDSGSTNLADGMEGDFATYLADIVAHFRDQEGIEFDALSPFNEPQWNWEAGTQEGCRYSAADMKRVIDALAANPGLGNTEIEVPESGSMDDLWEGESYLRTFFDPESPAYSGDVVAPRIAAHSYKTDLPSTGLVERRKKLRSELDYLPDVDYAMTEFCVLGKHGRGRDLGIDTALHVARLMHFDLVVGGAVTWQWWLAVSPYAYKDGLIYIDHEPDDGDFFESKLLWAMGNYSRFVRPGMVRLDVRRSDNATHEETVEGLMVSSYFDRDLEIVATVFINWTAEAAPVSLAVEGAAVNEWIPYVTSAEYDLKSYLPAASVGTILLPARSIVTLVGRLDTAVRQSAKGA